MPESTIRVLRDDCSCAENLVGTLGAEIRVEKRSFIFFRIRDVVEKKKSDPRRSLLSQKVFFRVSFFTKTKERKILLKLNEKSF